MRKGIEDLISESKAEGREEGREEGLTCVIRNMLNKGRSLLEISELTECELSYIEKIKQTI